MHLLHHHILLPLAPFLNILKLSCIHLFGSKIPSTQHSAFLLEPLPYYFPDTWIPSRLFTLLTLQVGTLSKCISGHVTQTHPHLPTILKWLHIDLRIMIKHALAPSHGLNIVLYNSLFSFSSLKYVFFLWLG